MKGLESRMTYNRETKCTIKPINNQTQVLQIAQSKERIFCLEQQNLEKKHNQVAAGE